jgi:glycosyltransferase involved in cell wall biosynthesis
VLTSASAFAKGIVTRQGTVHVCYCHAPTRFLWDQTHDILAESRGRGMVHSLLQCTLHVLRLWDQMSARRVDEFVANSETTRARIAKYYRRDATVLYPPVDLARFRPTGRAAGPRTTFLCVSRLSPYKRVDLVIETFNKLELPLTVVGTGRDRSRLERMAGPTVTLLGFVPEEELPRLYATARAVIFPSDDDFGLVPVEAMASGTPVLALRRGGARETVVEGVTGEFFDEPLEELLADCVRRFLDREHTYDQSAIRAHTAQFTAERFRSELRSLVERSWELRQRRAQRAVTLAGPRSPR